MGSMYNRYIFTKEKNQINIRSVVTIDCTEFEVELVVSLFDSIDFQITIAIDVQDNMALQSVDKILVNVYTYLCNMEYFV